MRFDAEFGNIKGSRIRERALQAVSDLDKHFAVLDEDEEDRSVPRLFLPYLPRLRNATRVVSDVRIGLHRRKNRDDHLVRGVAFELSQLIIEALCRAWRDDVRVVVEVFRRLRRNHFRRERRWPEGHY